MDECQEFNSSSISPRKELHERTSQPYLVVASSHGTKVSNGLVNPGRYPFPANPQQGVSQAFTNSDRPINIMEFKNV